MTRRPALELVLASANPHKVAEIAAILEAELGADVVLRARPPDVDDVDEDAPDLVGNARLKALAMCEATGLGAVSDDTGLEVDALGGEPGVRSARFAGEPPDDAANVSLVLERLTRSGDGARRARFRTVALVRFPDGSELVAGGSVEGRICDRPRGEAGFGYDPVFVPDDGDGRTFAEMTADEKHAISHRGRAFRALAVALAARRIGSPDGG